MTFRQQSRQKQSAKTRCRGFTLLELLVALAIFSLMAVIAYGGLQSVLSSQETIEIEIKRLNDLQMTFSIMGRDIENMVARKIRGKYGDIEPAMRSDDNLTVAYFELSRLGGHILPVNHKSAIERVAYTLEDGNLFRQYWRVLDRSQDSSPIKMILMQGVEELHVRLLDDDMQWNRSWGNGEDKSSLPKAVEIEIVVEKLGSIKRLYGLANNS